MNIEAYDSDSLRRIVRLLEYENRLLKEKLDKENIPYEDISPFEETIDHVQEYDPDQGGRIIHPKHITDEMANRFFALFWGRQDVYAKRGRKGGYFPQCENRWNNQICPWQRGEKHNCENCVYKNWKRIELKNITAHLLGYKEDGSDVIGVYPLLPDGTCRFLVFDFDNHEKGAEASDFANTDNEWHKEVDAIRNICEMNGIHPLVERSRSGRGAHVWIFFSKAIPAAVARNFGFLLLDRGAASINLKSFHFYDRMYPSQDVASSTSMELLQKVNAKYVYGVSATPKRGDKMDRIICMMLGPIRHKFTALERAEEQGIGHYFIPRYTRAVDTSDTRENISKAYSLISESKVRNEMIINDVKECIAKNRTPVILTRFKEQAKLLYDNLVSSADHVLLLYGDNTDKENTEIRNRLKEIPGNESLILVATGQKIGEGFDFPRLDVLMLAAPVSYEGRLEQYVGRLNRDYEGKEAVYVYDYIDSHMLYFDRMYAKRLRTYKKLGFSIWEGYKKEKQVTHAIFDSGDYMEQFDQDIIEAEKSIVISSPDIRQNRIDRLLSLAKDRLEAGVRITVITMDPEEIAYGSANICYELIDRMRNSGIEVVTRTEVEEP